EMMQLGIVLALARLYHGTPAHRAKLSWWLLIPATMIAIPVGLVAMEPDLGTAMLIALTGAAIVVLAGLSWRLIGIALAGALAAVVPVVTFVLHDYQRERIFTFLNPESDPSGAGYHILQSMI